MTAYILAGLFIVSAIIGYFLINNVPTLLHTPLMSGMNALSGIAVLGAIGSAAAAVYLRNEIFAYIAVVLAMINVVGGFGVTDRMLGMFKSGKGGKGDK